MFSRGYKKKGVEHLSTYLKTTRSEISLISKAAELSRRECHSRLSTGRLAVCSTCPRETSELLSGRRRPRHLDRRVLPARGSRLSPRPPILCPLKITNHSSWLPFLTSSWLELEFVWVIWT